MNHDTIILAPELVTLEEYERAGTRVLAVTIHTDDLGAFMLPVNEHMAVQLSRQLGRFARRDQYWEAP